MSKTITIHLEEGYDNILSVTAVGGCGAATTNATVQVVDAGKCDSIYINKDGKAKVLDMFGDEL